MSSLTHVARRNLKIRAEQGKASRQRLSGPVYPGRPSWGWGSGAVVKPNVGRQLSANQSHTSYVLRGYLFWGVKLTYTINRQEGSLVAGAGSRSQEQAPEPRAGTKRPYSGYASLFKREIYHAPVGWYFSSYWLTERKSLPAALWARISATIG